MTTLPVVASFDYGGVLHWTELIATYILLVVAICSFFGLVHDETNTGRQTSRGSALLAVATTWMLFVCLQTFTVSASLAETLVPGIASAYSDWSTPLLAGAAPDQLPLSIVPEQTQHFAAVACVMVMLAWCAYWVFDTPTKVAWLLLAISIGIALQSTYGLWCTLFPEYAPGFHAVRTLSFGSFINRNHASLFLSLGFGASLGVVVWRVNLLRMLVGEDDFEWDDLLSLFYDRLCIAGAVSGATCLAGMVVSGSMVGLLGCIAGVIATIHWFQSRYHVMAMICGLVICLGGGVFIWSSSSSADPTQSPFYSQIGEQTPVWETDSRWRHWQDGVAAAQAYLPLGSGTATYEYAYLPYQQVGAPYWFRHADNLWLELTVEQGIVAPLFILLVLVLAWLPTRFLREDVEPIDMGLRVTATFTIGTIMVTQLFDFGLLLIPSFIVGILLVMAAVARGHIAGYLATVDLNQEPEPANPRSIWFAAIAGAALFIFSVFSVPTLLADARTEAAVRECQNLVTQKSTDADAIDAALEKVDASLQSQVTHAAASIASQLRHRRARLLDIEEQDLPAEEMQEAYRETGNLRKRLQSLDSADNERESFRLYQQARVDAEVSLIHNPLAIDPRVQLVYLDFAGGSKETTRTTIKQLARLQNRDAKNLMRFAAMAETGGDLELASTIHRNVCELDPRYSGLSVQYVERNPSVSLSELIPDTTACRVAAAKHLLKFDAKDYPIHDQVEQFLTQSLPRFNCESMTSKAQRSNCEFLAGDICFHIGDVPRGLGHYAQAVQLTPADAARRLIFVQKLYQSGREDIALVEARRARFQIPGDTRFQSFIDKMAKENVEEALQ
ncbi:MAG: O-antigen ligase family protein [Planctomycetota bacterium]